MIGVLLFAIFAILGIVSCALVFVFRDMLHVVAALSAFFLINSFLFLLLHQPLLAVVQIFVLIGGLATFLFIGVASAAYSKFRYTKFIGLILLWAVLFVAIAFPLFGLQLTAASAPGLLSSTGIGVPIVTGIAQFYIMLVVMFGMALGAILLLKRMTPK